MVGLSTMTLYHTCAKQLHNKAGYAWHSCDNRYEHEDAEMRRTVEKGDGLISA